jgi:hypothetical protein
MLADNRRSSKRLISIFDSLTQAGWTSVTVAKQEALPINAYLSPTLLDKTKSTASLWIQGGIHGEEPASGEAFADEINTISTLGQTTPIVFLPLLSPFARDKDWRYENEHRDYTKGLSVTACDHMLLGKDDQLRSQEPVSGTAQAITAWISQTVKQYPPKLVIDHHEDRIPEDSRDIKHRSLRSCYVYLSGKGKNTHAIGTTIITAMKSTGLTIARQGTTRFGEPIINGMIQNEADGSIDEFYTVNKFYDPQTKKIEKKIPAETVVVVETTVPVENPVPLIDRVQAHRAVIRQYSHLWTLVNSQST